MIRSARLLFALVSVAAIFVFAVPARAGIIFIVGPGNIPGDENVLFKQTGLVSSGAVVQGLTSSTGLIVSFESDDQLFVSARGQARIEGPFDSLRIYLDDDAASFTSLMFNLDAAANGFVTITVYPWNSSSVNPLDKSGQNFFQIIATGGDRMTKVSFISNVGIDDIGQVRIGGAGIPLTATSTAGGPEPVPEPGSLLLLGSGLAVFGLLGRWRRRPKH